MQKANELPQSKLSHFKMRLNIADVRTMFVLAVLCPRCLHCLRALSVSSVLSAYSLRGLYAVSVLPPRLDVRPLKCHPYCVRAVRTLTILHPLLSAGNFGQFVHPLLHPYWLRTLYAKFRPYSIRSDPQRPRVGVKGLLEQPTCSIITYNAIVSFNSSLLTSKINYYMF